jgi:hypothetical protein
VYAITMSDDKEADPRPDPQSGDVLADLSDGDVIRFKPEELPGKPGTKPLTIQFEIEVATGKRGEAVALAQTAAIRDVLDWLASKKAGKDEGERPGTPRPQAAEDRAVPLHQPGNQG